METIIDKNDMEDKIDKLRGQIKQIVIDQDLDLQDHNAYLMRFEKRNVDRSLKINSLQYEIGILFSEGNNFTSDNIDAVVSNVGANNCLLKTYKLVHLGSVFVEFIEAEKVYVNEHCIQFFIGESLIAQFHNTWSFLVVKEINNIKS